ncbi:MAG: hypothetical protein B7Y39_12475 [Bdellovibrio sp. 28-41-41]|nr:MAG: hypothetical protein B7Y39_12475 [Bdellovibrio sp. 28-41-41]
METKKAEHHHSQEALMHIRVAIDNLKSVESMLNEQKPCTDVVSRLSGILATIAECRGIVAQDHITSCIQSALPPGKESVLNEVSILFQQILKGPIQGSHH